MIRLPSKQRVHDYILWGMVLGTGSNWTILRHPSGEIVCAFLVGTSPKISHTSRLRNVVFWLTPDGNIDHGEMTQPNDWEVLTDLMRIAEGIEIEFINGHQE
jgi:hypothetical protein